MYERITAVLNSAATDDRIIMTVLTGEGDFYSSGNDITGYLNASLSNTDESLDGFENYVKSASKIIQ